MSETVDEADYGFWLVTGDSIYHSVHGFIGLVRRQQRSARSGHTSRFPQMQIGDAEQIRRGSDQGAVGGGLKYGTVEEETVAAHWEGMPQQQRGGKGTGLF